MEFFFLFSKRKDELFVHLIEYYLSDLFYGFIKIIIAYDMLIHVCFFQFSFGLGDPLHNRLFIFRTSFS